MVNRNVELFQQTHDIIKNILDDSEHLCKTVEIEFGLDGVIRKELDSFESQIKACENVADPDVKEYVNLHDLRAYFNLKKDMVSLEENEHVRQHLGRPRIWLDNPYIRHYIFKQHRLERIEKRSTKLLKLYENEYPAEKDLESTIGQLDSKLAKLKDGNDVVVSLSETLKTYSDWRNIATKRAHGLLYAAMSYIQVAITYLDINFDKKLLASDEKSIGTFRSLTRQRDRIVNRLAKFEKFGPEVVKIGYGEALFDYRNHYSAAMYESDDILSEWPSNTDLFVSTMAGGDDCYDDEGEGPGKTDPGSSGRFN